MKKINYNKIIFKLNFIKLISSKNVMFLVTLLIFLVSIGSILFVVNTNYILNILIICFLHILIWKLFIEKYIDDNNKYRTCLIIFIEKLKFRKLK
jgi:hypothetical protein